MSKKSFLFSILILFFAFLVWIVFKNQDPKELEEVSPLKTKHAPKSSKSLNKENNTLLLKNYFSECSPENGQRILKEVLIPLKGQAENVFKNLHFKNLDGEVFRYRTFTDQRKKEVFFKEDRDGFPRKLDLNEEEKKSLFEKLKQSTIIFNEEGFDVSSSHGKIYWEEKAGKLNFVQWFQNGETYECSQK